MITSENLNITKENLDNSKIKLILMNINFAYMYTNVDERIEKILKIHNKNKDIPIIFYAYNGGCAFFRISQNHIEDYDKKDYPNWRTLHTQVSFFNQLFEFPLIENYVYVKDYLYYKDFNKFVIPNDTEQNEFMFNPEFNFYVGGIIPYLCNLYSINKEEIVYYHSTYFQNQSEKFNPIWLEIQRSTNY